MSTMGHCIISHTLKRMMYGTGLTVPQPYKKSSFYGEKKNIATLF